MTRAGWGLLMLVFALAGCASQETLADRAGAARVNTQLGINYAQRGQYTIAIDKLKRAIKQDESSAPAHAAIAYVYQNTGELHKAEHHYRRALDLAPEDPALKNNFGVFLCSQNRFGEAEAAFLEAARDPRYATPAAAWTNAGLCMKSHDLEKAEQYLREALQLQPDYRDALAQMAIVSFRQGEYLRTRAFLQRYDLGKSASADLLYIAARTEEALGDTKAARDFERRLQTEFPESAEANYSPPSPQ
jgi:type IV pilus assembly protein PilF